MSFNIKNLTSTAKEALDIAKEEAQFLRNKYCGTEHILLGLIAIEDTLVTNMLENFDVDAYELKQVIHDNIAQEGQEEINVKDIVLTPRVNRVLKRSEEFAKKLERDKVDVEHIFLGLLYESDGVGNNILRSFGVEYDKVRQEINKELGRVDEEDTGGKSIKQDDSEIKNFTKVWC